MDIKDATMDELFDAMRKLLRANVDDKELSLYVGVFTGSHSPEERTFASENTSEETSYILDIEYINETLNEGVEAPDRIKNMIPQLAKLGISDLEYCE